MATSSNNCKLHVLLVEREYKGARIHHKVQSACEIRYFSFKSSAFAKKRITEGRNSSFRVVFSPDSEYMVTAHRSHEILVFSLTPRCKLLRSLQGHERSPWCMAFHPTEPHLLLVGDLGGKIKVWNIHTAECLSTWHSSEGSPVSCVSFHPTLPNLVLVCTSDEVNLLHCSTTHLCSIAIYKMSTITPLAVYSNDGCFSVVASSCTQHTFFGPYPPHKLLLFPSPHSLRPLCSAELLQTMESDARIYGPESYSMRNNMFFYFTQGAIRCVSLLQSTLGQVVANCRLPEQPFSMSVSPHVNCILVLYRLPNHHPSLIRVMWRPCGACRIKEFLQKDFDIDTPHSVNTLVFLPSHTMGLVWGNSLGDVWTSVVNSC